MYSFVERYGREAVDLAINLMACEWRLRKLWFWEQWFKTERYKNIMADLQDILEETNCAVQYRLSPEATNWLVDILNNVWDTYRSWGG